jgi:hypothetical protein
VKEGAVKQPFTLIDPDMIMLKPVQPEPGVTCQRVCYMERRHLLRVDGYDESYIYDQWQPCGVVYQFNGVPDGVFDEIYNECEKLLKYRELKIGTSLWQREMVGFAHVLGRRDDVKLRTDYQIPLDTRHKGKPANVFGNFIHYCNGYLPWFNKRSHNELLSFSFDSPLPFETILKLPSLGNPVVQKFKNNTISFIKNNMDRVETI